MFEQTQNQGQTSQVPAQAILEPTVMPASVASQPSAAANYGAAGPTIAGPKDMFADVDEPAASQQAAAQPSKGSGAEGYTFEEEEEPTHWYLQKKFIILLLGVVLLLIIVIFGVQFALRFFVKPVAPIIPAEQPAKAAPLAPEPTQPESLPSQEQQQQQPVTPAQVDANQQQNGQQSDTDDDGLLDAEEQAIGSSITLPDTDGDGLSDREEFRVFGTDPKNPDSDGDTYIDGAEVKNGYNPKGQGKLFTIPTE